MPISFDIDVDLGSIAKEMRDAVDHNARIAFEQGLDNMASLAKGFAPSKTGELANAIRRGEVDGTYSDGTLHGYVVAATPYAEAQEFGSGIHGERGAKYPILPRYKKALRWAISGSIGGGEDGYRFSKGVMHPGVPAKRYLQQAVDAGLGDMTAELAAAVADGIEGERA